jgi:hypothetical protein
MEDRCSWLERPIMRICDLLLGLPPSLADHLDEAAELLGVELAIWREADAKLEALWSSAA